MRAVWFVGPATTAIIHLASLILSSVRCSRKQYSAGELNGRVNGPHFGDFGARTIPSAAAEYPVRRRFRSPWPLGCQPFI
jgi:hypothetical protein